MLIPGLICDSPVSRLTVRHELTCRLATCRMPRVSNPRPSAWKAGALRSRLLRASYCNSIQRPAFHCPFCTLVYRAIALLFQLALYVGFMQVMCGNYTGNLPFTGILQVISRPLFYKSTFGPFVPPALHIGFFRGLYLDHGYVPSD